MGKIALIALVGNEDTGVNLPEGTYLRQANLSLFRNYDQYDVSLHAFLKSLKKLKLEPSELSMDLLVIAAVMYGADTRINRKDFAEDGWTRIIDLFIPVSDVSVWNNQKENLERIFKFLTGDIWTVIFRPRAGTDLQLSPRGKLKRYKMPYETDTVCLFSGGMDSFIGAIDLLESNVRPLLVGHKKSGDVSKFQKICGDALVAAYPLLSPQQISTHIAIPKTNLFDSQEDTERGRSFLFLTLGAICASVLNANSTLVVPENGMISLNIPLTPLRTGSHSTRTTHPFYFSKMQQLFNALNLGVKISNPYQYQTKGEMLTNCKNKSLVVNTETMSCSHPSGRYEGLGNLHCGYCVPCIIRKAAFLASEQQDKYPYRTEIIGHQGLSIAKAEGADILAFKFMVEKVKKNPNFLTAAIRLTGPLGEDVLPFIDLYSRSLIEVNNLIKQVKLI
ncbi:Qat anti-phage system QueC-like protein QatC [Pedobacter nutrimenti]|uniref:7-cyano-7-deazaguanine synthase n=1 Tax=Pedobacter nutrimenti TaxID=1241337 RepID=A0A318U813_9SPHI|nr:Qat anti-phage system QueC-like protein QatC [Pedobacter nutrimenti]PYF70583.1 7-cyano-7-deazaguanine synthase in queuosine biosynthesis [Pedobacter nutrimenti]